MSRPPISMQGKYLYIFNLETNLDSYALAFTHDWISEFSKYYEKIFVYSFKVGKTNLPSNVSVYELGSGGIFQRVKNLSLHLIAMLRIILGRTETQVFYHMNPRSAMLIGLPLRLFRINQILWYSHSAISKSLRLATLIVNSIVSTSTHSFPISTEKLICTGHGIRFPEIAQSIFSKKKAIVVLGRVSRSKRIHELILETAKFNTNNTNENLTIDIFGTTLTIDDSRYLEELKVIANSYKVIVRFMGPIPKAEVYGRIATYLIAYNGMLRTIDKAAIESTYAGCYLVSDQIETLRECGLLVEDEISGDILLSINEQLEFINQMSEVDIIQKRLYARTYIVEKHSLDNTIKKIVLLLMGQEAKN